MMLIPSTIVLAILGTGDGGSRTGPADMDLYRAAAAREARDAQAHVRLALWCEAHHLDQEHDAELAEALRLNPHDAAARGLKGEVREGEPWLTVAEAVKLQAQPRRQALLGEYDSRRDAAGDTVKGNMELARWCSIRGLRSEEHAHLAAVLRRDPALAEAWQALGYHNREGAWINPAHEASVRRLHVEAREAHRRWSNHLKLLLRERSSADKRPGAETELASIHDPEAVPAIAVLMGNGSIEDRQLAAKLLGQIEGPESTSRLAWLAIHDTEGPVRGAASDALAGRDPREFIGPIIGYLQEPPKLTIKPLKGPGEPGGIEVEGMQARVYAIPSMEEFRVGTGNPPEPVDTTWLTAMASGTPGIRTVNGYDYTASYFPPDPAVAQAFTQLAANPAEAAPILRGLAGLASGNPSSPPPLTYRVTVPRRYVRDGYYTRALASQVRNSIRNQERMIRNEYNLYCTEIRNQFKADCKAVREHVGTIERTSANTLALLQELTGLGLGLDQAAWSAWWADWNRSEPPIGLAALNNDAPIPPPAAPAPALAPAPATSRLHRPRLAQGTMVRTSRGMKPVESLRVGDLVLSQDPLKGSLSFQGVVAITAPTTDSLLRLRLDGGGPLLVAPVLPVWKAGQGWLHARDLKPGDAVRVVGGRATVISLEPDPDASAINVVLVDHGTLFVGERGLLVHDNGIVHPPIRVFDTVDDKIVARDEESRQGGKVRP